jgi:hypothetical protein
MEITLPQVLQILGESTVENVVLRNEIQKAQSEIARLQMALALQNGNTGDAKLTEAKVADGNN